MSAAPPSAFVETLFDQYAEKFDDALVKTLDYRVPEFLAEAIAAQGREKFGLAIDLGCGTGLMGERLRPMVGNARRLRHLGRNAAQGAREGRL